MFTFLGNVGLKRRFTLNLGGALGMRALVASQSLVSLLTVASARRRISESRVARSNATAVRSGTSMGVHVSSQRTSLNETRRANVALVRSDTTMNAKVASKIAFAIVGIATQFTLVNFALLWHLGVHDVNSDLGSRYRGRSEWARRDQEDSGEPTIKR